MSRSGFHPLAFTAALLLSGCGDLLTADDPTVEVPQAGSYLLTSLDLRPLPDSVRTCSTCDWIIILPDTLSIGANLAVEWRFSWDPGAGDPRLDILSGSIVQTSSSTLSISGTWSGQPVNAFPQLKRIHYSVADSLVLVGDMPAGWGSLHTLGFRRVP